MKNINKLVIERGNQPNSIILSGDANSLLCDRRFSRYLKDNFQVINTGGTLIVQFEGTLEKTLEDFKRVLSKYGYSWALGERAEEALRHYHATAECFSEFSKEAYAIRNNHCVSSEFKSFSDSVDKNMPCRTLYNLQLLSAYHLAFSQNACNFSVPGAGKTSIVFGAYAYLHNLDESNPKYIDRMLIVSPLNAFSPWELEYKECYGVSASSKRILSCESRAMRTEYFHSLAPCEITLISYQSFAALAKDIEYFLLQGQVMVVLDEAHKIKNTLGGAQAQSVLKVAQYAKSRVVLTGTPVPNGYEDLYNLFEFIWPNKNILGLHPYQLRQVTQDANSDKVKNLIESISPYFMRIRKSDLGIPPANENPPVMVTMGEYQKKIYSLIEKKSLGGKANLSNSNNQFENNIAKARMIRLMQAASNPALLKYPLEDFLEAEFGRVDVNDLAEDSELMAAIQSYENIEVPPKFIRAEEIIRKIINQGGKVIVWAVFIQTIHDFRKYLNSVGIAAEELYGGIPIAGLEETESENAVMTREKIVADFHRIDSPYKVIIANPAAVAESISLHKACHNALYLERSFNAAHFVQSKDRIHRYGLPADAETNYYYLMSEESIDTAIDRRLREKEGRMNEIIEGSEIPLFENALESFGYADIKAVLKDYAQRTNQRF